ncbi:uncharacterized protein LOC135215795 [Macrobrachium nipponense]|uniref:uncharacterized protein LOC135215795 n=1 Tax=Macrobrachium nipponense TaxID=159736 RepID=UPI0030C8C900
MLFLYRDRIYRFNNEHIDKLELWEEIVQHLKEEAHYFTTVEKVRSRFSELTKQFTTVEQHNSQSGTIRRECKHHELLSEIYNVYNYWPHDKSTISLNKSNSLRMRQVNAQLAWSENQSRAVLQLYPQILVSHISSGDHQPIEEFWLQLAKAYLNTQGDRKQCYEIEEHIALLRRGYHSRNPFPFCNELQLLEETEVTLGFSPDPVVAEDDQFVPYWSHDAAILLLDLVISYRQDGRKYAGLFELISRDMGSHGYRYTGEECRVYYFLLRQLYTNRLRTLKRNKELLKPFPYMDKMSQVDAVVSLPRFVETKGSCQVILTAALCVIQPFAGESEEEKFTYLLSLLTNTRLYIRQKNLLHPLPSVKKSLFTFNPSSLLSTHCQGKVRLAQPRLGVMLIWTALDHISPPWEDISTSVECNELQSKVVKAVIDEPLPDLQANAVSELSSSVKPKEKIKSRGNLNKSYDSFQSPPKSKKCRTASPIEFKTPISNRFNPLDDPFQPLSTSKPLEKMSRSCSNLSVTDPFPQSYAETATSEMEGKHADSLNILGLRYLWMTLPSYVTTYDAVSACNYLQKTINVISKWADEHGFRFSSSKTVAVRFTRCTRKETIPNLKLKDCLIPYKKEVKFWA